MPRLWTRPLRSGPPGPCGCGCALTPDTSVGFDQAAFAADVLRRPLLPWQRWVVIHAGELLPDGRLRFRIVHVMVARQNGKTEIPVVLSLFWQLVDQFPLILGTSTKLDYAKESWFKAIRLARKNAGPGGTLEGIIPLDSRKWTRKANGEQESWIGDYDGDCSRYKIAPANEEGGRSLSIDRLVLDELRQHTDYGAWGAAVPATNARPGAQVWTLSNAGTDASVVLNDERAAALRALKAGPEVLAELDRGWFEYSAPADAHPADPAALAQANPAYGYSPGLDPRGLLAEARTALDVGGEKLATFRIECMCIHVQQLDPAIDATAWAACEPAADLSAWRSRVALCLDVAPDGLHAVIYAAAVAPSGTVHVDPVEAWSGPTASAQLRAALPGIVARVRPRLVGWFPSGPAAAVAAQVAERKHPGSRWPPPGVDVAAIKGDTAAVCMGFAEIVKAGQVAHPNDPLLNAQVAGAEKAKRGSTWVFDRGGAAYVDAVYAAAGAAHLARTMPPSVGRPRVVVPN